MPLVKYDGTAVTYMRGTYRFAVDKNRTTMVADADLKMFLDKSNPGNMLENDAPAFRVIEETIDSEADSITKASSQFRVGGFATKAEAIKFAAELYDVRLSANISLSELNEQTVLLQMRVRAGTPYKQLLTGLRDARFGGADEDDLDVQLTAHGDDDKPGDPAVVKAKAVAAKVTTDDDDDLSDEEEAAIFDEATADKPAPGVDKKLVALATEAVKATQGEPAPRTVKITRPTKPVSDKNTVVI